VPIITIVIIIVVILTAPWIPGHLASRSWSCRDARQHGANPGHLGKSGMGGNPNSPPLSATSPTRPLCQFKLHYIPAPEQQHSAPATTLCSTRKF